MVRLAVMIGHVYFILSFNAVPETTKHNAFIFDSFFSFLGRAAKDEVQKSPARIDSIREHQASKVCDEFGSGSKEKTDKFTPELEMGGST